MAAPPATLPTDPPVVALRRSTADDAHEIAPLILEAAPYLRLLLGSAHDAWHAAEDCFRGDRTMFGARFGLIAEEVREVAGFVIAFPGKQWASLKLGTGVVLARSAGVKHASDLVKRARLLDRLQPPVPRETLYVSALAVHRRHRRRGIAKALMQRVVEGASRLELGVALDVDVDHEAARKLYGSLGFHEAGLHQTSPGQRGLLQTAGFARMVRPLVSRAGAESGSSRGAAGTDDLRA